MPIAFLEDIKTIIPGQKGGGNHRYSNSRKASVAVKAGLLTVPNGDGLCKLPTVLADVTAGFGSIAEYLVDRIPNADGFEYQIGDYVGAIRQGLVAVITEEAVVDNEPCYVRYADGAGGTQKGAFRNDADTTTAGLLPRARFVGSWPSGVALVEFL